MGTFRVFSQAGEPIASVEEWFEKAPPAQGARHWKDGRSAKELARRWVKGVMPPEITALLTSSSAVATFAPEAALAEFKTALDNFPGNTRNHDLVVPGHLSATEEKALLCVEGKADEPFGDTIGKCLDGCEPSSNLPKRIRALSLAILGTEPHLVATLRYQLLHAIGASLIEGSKRDVEHTVFCIHEFHSDAVQPSCLAQNAQDLDAFISRLTGGAIESAKAGVLYGPLVVPGGERIPSQAKVYVGKAVARL